MWVVRSSRLGADVHVPSLALATVVERHTIRVIRLSLEMTTDEGASSLAR
jgi:hypothetical protein